LDALKAPGELLPTIIHQIGVNLVIDKPIHFQDAIPQVLTFVENTLLQKLHDRLLYQRSPSA
jgi:hypothetical protein